VNSGQVVPALICALLRQGVEPCVIEHAVSEVTTLRLGSSICGNNSLHRAFATEQTNLLERERTGA
jgi:hypothetical protein